MDTKINDLGLITEFTDAHQLETDVGGVTAGKVTPPLIQDRILRDSAGQATTAQILVDGTDYTKGVSTQVTLKRVPTSDEHLRIKFEGTPQPRSSWSISGNTVTFTVFIPADIDTVEIDTLTGSIVGDVFVDTVDYDKGADDHILLSVEPEDDANVVIYFEGNPQVRSSWTRVGQVITFTGGIPGDIDEIEADITIGTVKTETLLDTVGFTAGSSTQITIVNPPMLKDHLDIYFDGVFQVRSGWSFSDNTVTFLIAIPGGTAEIDVDTLVSSPGARTITDAERVAIESNKARANVAKTLFEGATKDFEAGVDDTITLPFSPISDAHLTIFFDTIEQPRSTWTRTGDQVQFTATIPGGIAEIVLDYYKGNVVAEVFTDGVEYTKGTSTTLTLATVPSSEAQLRIRFEGGWQPRSTFSVAGKVVTFTLAIPGDIDEIEIDTLGGDIVAQALVDPGDYTKGTSKSITLSDTPASKDDLKIRFEGAIKENWVLQGNVVTFRKLIPIDIDEIEADILISAGSIPFNAASTSVVQQYTKQQFFGTQLLTGLGVDQVLDGDMTVSGSWTVQGVGWSIAAGVANSDASQVADSDLTQTPAIALINGQTYKHTFTVTNYVAGNITPVIGDTEGTDRAANGTFTEIIVAGAGTDIDMRADLDFDGDIDDVIVEIINVSWGLDDEQVAELTIDEDLILDNPTNMKDGATYILRVIQDGTGTRLLTFGSAYRFPDATAPTLSTGAGDVDYITFISDGVNMDGVIQKNFG